MSILTERVIACSESNNWADAVKEWYINDYRTDHIGHNNQCICGQCNLVRLYTIKNSQNGNELYPIGSTCIKLFQRSDLDEEIHRLEERLVFLENVRKGGYIKMDSSCFSRNILRWLYDSGALYQINDIYTGKQNYEFLIDMFNKRNKKDITVKQQKRISWLIINRIKPFVDQQANERVN